MCMSTLLGVATSVTETDLHVAEHLGVFFLRECVCPLLMDQLNWHSPGAELLGSETPGDSGTPSPR